MIFCGLDKGVYGVDGALVMAMDARVLMACREDQSEWKIRELKKANKNEILV